jgi:hypothetical protein
LTARIVKRLNEVTSKKELAPTNADSLPLHKVFPTISLNFLVFAFFSFVLFLVVLNFEISALPFETRLQPFLLLDYFGFRPCNPTYSLLSSCDHNTAWLIN